MRWRQSFKGYPGNRLFFFETEEVVTNCDHLSVLKFSPNRAYAFTERGVAMRHFLISNAQVFQRLDRIELKQLETNHKIEQVFEKLESN